jgi:hypothetical protein
MVVRTFGCIVLGRGADEKTVVTWLETAASVLGFIGFAVASYQAHTITRQEASVRIARRFLEWAARFERAHPSGT